jgi:hypothetical protein
LLVNAEITYNACEGDLMTKIAGVVQTLKKEHDRLTRELKGISAALSAFGASYRTNGGTHKISAAGRARIAAAQRARWAKATLNGSKASVVSRPKKRSLSVAARKKIAAAQRARWAKVKAAKKSA